MKYRVVPYVRAVEEGDEGFKTLQEAMEEAEHIESIQPGETITLIEHIDDDGVITLIYPYAYQYNQS